MGNTNDTSHNIEEVNGGDYTYHTADEKENNKPNFFQSMFCCGNQNNFHDNFMNKNDISKSEYYWYYESDSKSLKNHNSKTVWIPYSIELNNLFEEAFSNKNERFDFNFAENKYEKYSIDFSSMTQNKAKSSNMLDGQNYYFKPLRVNRMHKDEDKVIIRYNEVAEKDNFLTSNNFIREYNNTHNIQKPVKLISLFKFLSFPIKFIDIFNQEIYLVPSLVAKFKTYFSNLKINSFPHLKQLLIDDIKSEAEALNSALSNHYEVSSKRQSGQPLANNVLQAQIYTEIIESNLNQDNLDSIIIYLYTLEGFINENINSALKSDCFENTYLKLFFVILLASITKQSGTDLYRFIKANNLFIEERENNNYKKVLKLYKGCYLSQQAINGYFDMLRDKKTTQPEEEENNMDHSCNNIIFIFFKNNQLY